MPFPHFHPHGVGAPSFELFKNGSNYLPSVDRLIPALEINSVTVEPEFRYKGGDADSSNWDAWGYGNTLALQAGTAPSYNQGSPLLGDSDDSVRINDGGSYQDGAAVLGDIGTEDFVFEMIFKAIAVNKSVCGKRNTVGWLIQFDVSNQLKGRFEDAGGNSSVISVALDLGVWYHGLIFVNRDEASTNGAQVYINGAASGAGGDISARSGTFSNPFSLRVGGGTAPSGAVFQGNVAYAAMWKRSDWHKAGADGPAEWAVIAKDRFARLTAVHANRSHDSKTPSVMTRASVAYLDKLESGVRKLYLVGPNWPRTVSREDSASTAIKGYVNETAKINKCLQSETFQNTWDQLDDGDSIAQNSKTAPNKLAAGDGLRADATDGNHGVSQQITLTAVNHTLSVFAKAGVQDWLCLTDATVNDTDGYFDLANGVKGTMGANVVYSHMEDWGDDWYRCGITFLATAADHTIIIQAAASDGDSTFAGNGSSTTVWLWGAQVENMDYPLSYVPRVTAVASRGWERLTYDITNSAVETGTVVADALWAVAKYGYPYVASLSDNQQATLRIGLYQHAAGRMTWLGVDTDVQWNITGPTDFVNDNVVYETRAVWKPNDIELFVDGASQGTDTSATIPALTHLDVGDSQGGTNASDGVVSNLRIYKRRVLK